MKLHIINSFNEFKNIKNQNLLLEDSRSMSTMANTTKFSDSLIGRGSISLLKLLKRGKDFLKLGLYKRKYDSELAMGILRAYKEYEKNQNDVQNDIQNDVQNNNDQNNVQNNNDQNNVQNNDEQNNIQNKNNQNKNYIKNSRIFLNSILEISNIIEENAIRFKGKGEFGENYGKLLNKLTYFDFEKYQNMKNIYKKDKNNTKILKNLLSMLKNGLESALSNNNKNEINLFNQELKIYGDKYWKMVTDKVDKNKKDTFTEISKDIINRVKTDSTSINDIKDLLKNQKVNNKYKELLYRWVDNQKKNNGNIKPGQGTRKRIMKDALKSLGMLNENLILEEVESNLQDNENHSKNAWNKVIRVYKQSNIKKYLNDIEKLLKTDLSKGKEEYKKSINDIILITKQVVNNISVSGPIKFDDLIKEGLYDNDIPKSITLFSKVLLSFKEDMGLLGTYGSATEPMKNFINSFYNMKEILTKSNENYNFNYQMINEKLYKKIYGDDTKLDWSYFKDPAKSKKMFSAFKNKNKINVNIGDKSKEITIGEYLKNKATELTNIDAIYAIQYSVQSAIRHTKTPNSNKLFAGEGGGIGENETYLARIWKKMINDVKSKYQPYLNTDKLDPNILFNKKDGNNINEPLIQSTQQSVDKIVETAEIIDYLKKKTTGEEKYNNGKFIVMTKNKEFYFLNKYNINNYKFYSYKFNFQWDDINKKDSGKFIKPKIFDKDLQNNPSVVIDDKYLLNSSIIVKMEWNNTPKYINEIVKILYCKDNDQIFNLEVKTNKSTLKVSDIFDQLK
jgi:hypothetical protein